MRVTTCPVGGDDPVPLLTWTTAHHSTNGTDPLTTLAALEVYGGHQQAEGGWGNGAKQQQQAARAQQPSDLRPGTRARALPP